VRALGRSVRPEATWILIAAALLAGPARPPAWNSFYTFEWGAVATMALAVVGRKDRRAAQLAIASPALAGAYLAIAAAVRAFGSNPRAGHADWALVAGGLFAIALSASRYSGRPGFVSRLTPVAFVSVQLFVGLGAHWLLYALGWDAVGPTTFSSYTVSGVFLVELPLLALALAGVGLGISRDWRSTVDRLGLRRPRFLTIGIGLTVAMLLRLVSPWVNLISYESSQTTYFKIRAILEVSQDVDLKTLILIALAAGFCEETLFRGALSPRVGILLSAVAFGLIHVQYGPSAVFVSVVVDGVIFGIMRRYLDTTAAITAHAVYDLPSVAFVSVGFALIVGMTLIVIAAIRERRTLRAALTLMWQALWLHEPPARQRARRWIAARPRRLQVSAPIAAALIVVATSVWISGPHLNSTTQGGELRLAVSNYPPDAGVGFYVVQPGGYLGIGSTTTDGSGNGSVSVRAFPRSGSYIVTACLRSQPSNCPASGLVTII